MAESGAQIDWAAMNGADVAASMRRSLQTNARPFSHLRAKAQAFAAPVAVQAPAASKSQINKRRALAGRPGVYAAAAALLIAAGVAGVWNANIRFAPEMYDDRGLVPAAEAFAESKNYAVFDLNLNIRRLREINAEKMTATPEVVLVGASQWQEAHAGLMRSRHMYNGHIHRDYWEDLLGTVEVYVRNKHLPRQMIIAIRDKQFTPVELRKDFLWEPGIPNYRAMARRLGIAAESSWRTEPYQRIKERLSLSMLFNNVTRWFNAPERPHASAERNFGTLDTLLPDGSILWSAQHLAIFTQERAKREALALADTARNNPPVIDPAGVEAFDKLLTFLKDQGTEVTFVHPPFNPIFYENVQGGTYMAGLDKVRTVVTGLAAKHGLKIIGDFNPAKVGCTADMYIDAEHSNPDCVVKVLRQFDALNEAADQSRAGKTP